MNFSQIPTSSNQIERRCEPRHRAFIHGNLANQTQNDFCTILNVSKNGLGIRSRKAFNTGEVVDVYLNSDESHRIQVQVNVLSCKHIEGEYFLGSKIVGINEKHKKHYETVLNAHRPAIIK